MPKFSFIPRSVLRNLLILGLSAVVFVFANSALFSASAAGNNPSNKEDRYVDLLTADKDFDSECGTGRERDTLYDALRDPITVLVDKYHETVNCIFNKRIEILVKKMLVGINTFGEDKPLTKEALEAILELLSPAKLDPNSGGVARKPCTPGKDGEPNLSTYCISQRLVEEYFAFRKGMMVAREKAKFEVNQRFETIGGANGEPGKIIEQRDIFHIGKNIQDYGAKLQRINDELELARTAMDQGLAAYNELQTALPMHRKYMEIIKALEKYRDKISKVRQSTDLYPATFLDVMTTKCT